MTHLHGVRQGTWDPYGEGDGPGTSPLRIDLGANFVHPWFPVIVPLAHALRNANVILVAALFASLVSQVVKGIVASVRARSLTWSRFWEPGGFPSSHSATVTALATAVVLTHGWQSDLFAVVAVLAVIVLYDAVNIRQQVGQHSKFLNILRDRETPWEKPFAELVGHTRAEVLTGALLGILLTLLFF